MYSTWFLMNNFVNFLFERFSKINGGGEEIFIYKKVINIQEGN